MNAGAVRAVPSTHKLYVNNQPADVAAYNIEGNNYFKLRDIAKLVDFHVLYDPQANCIRLTPDMSYEDDGSDTKTTVQATDDAKISQQVIYLNGQQQNPIIYNINGNNYFKLRDLGEMMDFGVGFTAATSRVDIDTEKPYAAEQTAPTTDNANQDNNQNETTSAMKEVSNNPGYFYDPSLVTIPAGVNISTLPDLENRLRNKAALIKVVAKKCFFMMSFSLLSKNN